MTAARRRVVAVVPVFAPPPALPSLVEALAAQVDGLVVVDDSGPTPGDSDPATGALLRRCHELGAVVVRHDTNQGIASALNTGVSQAFSLDPALDAVLTVDQDSTVPEDFVGSLVAAWDAGQAAGLPVGLVAPQGVGGLPDQVHGSRYGVLLGRDPVQSGTLLPASTWHAVGGFDESLVIDGVDADYALRCLDAGLVVVVAEGARLGHTLGDRQRVGPVEVTRSAPFRYYYLSRNRLALARRHGRRHPGWAVEQLAGLAGHLGIVLALAPGRRERAGAAARGLRDGLRGVRGPDPNR